MKVDFKTGTFYLGDCFEVMAELATGSVDMVLNDPPYGTTQNKWDAVIPFGPMWAAYWRLLKSNGAAVLTAAQPFSSALVMSQVDTFRYDWAWRKNRATNVLNAKKMPLRDKEDVLVFCKNSPSYFPQGLVFKPEPSRNSKTDGANYGAGTTKSYIQEFTNYPKQTLDFDVVQRVEHPTQKPVALFEYLVRTYTMPGELVLDNTAGSGTTAIAAMQSGRRWICIERDEDYFAKAIARVWDAEAAL